MGCAGIYFRERIEIQNKEFGVKTTLIKRKRLIGLLIVSFGLLGCEQHPRKLPADVIAARKVFTDKISLRADLIMPGMTRDEVVDILGPAYRTLNPQGSYTCDEFQYVTEIGAWYVLVWFENGVVDRVFGATHDECYLSIV